MEMAQRSHHNTVPTAIAVGAVYDSTATRDTEVEVEPTSTSVDYLDIHGKHICFGSCTLIAFIIICCTIPLSFHYVSYDEYALLRDVYGTVRLSKVYEQGRYFYPLNYDTIIFPANYMQVEFDVIVFTDNGLEFNVEIGFYYKLPRENVGKIYDAFSKNYDDLVKINAKTTIKNVAADLSVNDYINHRRRTELLFANAVHNVLGQNVMVDAPVDLFKMGEIHLPESVIDTSLESAIAIQNNELLLNTQAVEVVRSETNRLVAEIDAETSATLQFAINDAERIVEKSKSYANQVTLQSRGKGISAMLTDLGFSDSDLSNDIIEKLALLDNAGNATVIGSAVTSVIVDA